MAKKASLLKLFDFHNPFFKPLWIRLLVVGAVLAWGAFEVSLGSWGWAALFWAMGGLAFWQFFISPPEDWSARSDED